MNNKTGLILGFFLSFMILFFQGLIVRNHPLESIGSIIGVVGFNLIIALIISAFKSLNNFGKVFGYVSLFFFIIALINIV